jgi:hypothetical protein
MKKRMWVCPICEFLNILIPEATVVKCAHCLRSFQLEPDMIESDGEESAS